MVKNTRGQRTIMVCILWILNTMINSESPSCLITTNVIYVKKQFFFRIIRIYLSFGFGNYHENICFIISHKIIMIVMVIICFSRKYAQRQ